MTVVASRNVPPPCAPAGLRLVSTTVHLLPAAMWIKVLPKQGAMFRVPAAMWILLPRQPGLLPAAVICQAREDLFPPDAAVIRQAVPAHRFDLSAGLPSGLCSGQPRQRKPSYLPPTAGQNSHGKRLSQL